MQRRWGAEKGRRERRRQRQIDPSPMSGEGNSKKRRGKKRGRTTPERAPPFPPFPPPPREAEEPDTSMRCSWISLAYGAPMSVCVNPQWEPSVGSSGGRIDHSSTKAEQAGDVKAGEASSKPASSPVRPTRPSRPRREYGRRGERLAWRPCRGGRHRGAPACVPSSAETGAPKGVRH